MCRGCRRRDGQGETARGDPNCTRSSCQELFPFLNTLLLDPPPPNPPLPPLGVARRKRDQWSNTAGPCKNVSTPPPEPPPEPPSTVHVRVNAGSFAVFEYLNMGGRSSADKAELMGVQLARMHRTLSPNGKYGFDIDNTIGGEWRLGVWGQLYLMF